MKLNLFKKAVRPSDWEAEGDTIKRAYSSYAEYLDHQRAKLAGINNLDKKRDTLRAALAERLAGNPEISRGTTVLCLGARRGAECEVFIDRGAVAIGIDLNPGTDNPYVVTGDFHNLQYADASFDCAYTNSLDHVFDLPRVIGEVKRILKPRGIFFTDIVKGVKDPGGREPGRFAAFWWETNQTVIDTIASLGFAIESRHDFTAPFRGTHVVFRRL